MNLALANKDRHLAEKDYTLEQKDTQIQVTSGLVATSVYYWLIMVEFIAGSLNIWSPTDLSTPGVQGKDSIQRC